MMPFRNLLNTIVITGVVACNLATAQTQPPPGNSERGGTLFAGKAACTTCHRVKEQGSRLGLDLTRIGDSRQPAELRQAILDPPSQLQPQNRMYRVVTKEGVTITGKLLNQGTASLQMLDSNERLVSFQKSGLREHNFIDAPPMPSFRSTLSAAEVEDLVAFLSQLKGVSQ